VNQHVDFAWIANYKGKHPEDPRSSKLPTGASLCGVATLRMYLKYFDGVDLSVEQQVGLIDSVYIKDQGMSGEYASEWLNTDFARRWRVKTDFSTGGGVERLYADDERIEGIRQCIDHRYPVPVGLIKCVGTIEAPLRLCPNDTLKAGDVHPHAHAYGNGHWVLAVGYMKRKNDVIGLLINDPDTGCRARLDRAGFSQSAGSDGSVWRIATYSSALPPDVA
jgi:hypothetical protein